MQEFVKFYHIHNVGVHILRYICNLFACGVGEVFFDDTFEILSLAKIATHKSKFGRLAAQKKTLEEIGKEFGVTRERIRQIEKKANYKITGEKIKIIKKQLIDTVEMIRNNLEIRTLIPELEEIYLKGTTRDIYFGQEYDRIIKEIEG